MFESKRVHSSWGWGLVLGLLLQPFGAFAGKKPNKIKVYQVDNYTIEQPFGERITKNGITAYTLLVGTSYMGMTGHRGWSFNAKPSMNGKNVKEIIDPIIVRAVINTETK